MARKWRAETERAERDGSGRIGAEDLPGKTGRRSIDLDDDVAVGVLICSSSCDAAGRVRADQTGDRTLPTLPHGSTHGCDPRGSRRMIEAIQKNHGFP